MTRTLAAVERVRSIAELVFLALAAAFLVGLAFTLEATLGAGHHLLLIAGGILLGIGIGRRTT